MKIGGKELELWKRIAQEMRSEHDRGDGHFSTEEVELVEQFVAKAEVRKQPNRKRGIE